MSSTKKDTKPTPTATDTPQPLTRSLFVSPDYEKIAISKSTMFVLTKDGQGVEEVPMLASVRETGIVPEGFCVGESYPGITCCPGQATMHLISDMNVDPDTVVATLAKKGITNTRYARFFFFFLFRKLADIL
jgi:hypothetical protein